MIKKAIALLFFGVLLQTGAAEAGNYSKCSNACSAAKCQNKSIAEKCAEWCEGIPALEAVFNACKAKQPLAEHANLDAKHHAEQVKHGRAVGGGGPLAALPVAYNAVAVQAFCQAYAGNPGQIVLDHGPGIIQKVATIQGRVSGAPNEIRIRRSGNAGNQNTTIDEFGQANILVDATHLHDVPAAGGGGPSAPVAKAPREEYFNAAGPVNGGLIFGGPAAPAHLRNKGLCYFE